MAGLPMPRARIRRRRLSLTSLIDVIFLLLLFFMLSSTFSRFAEVELTSATAGTGAAGIPPMFLKLQPDALSLNGEPMTLEMLAEALQAGETPGDAARPLLVSLGPDVTSQRLTDLLGVLRRVRGIRATVLGGS